MNIRLIYHSSTFKVPRLDRGVRVFKSIQINGLVNNLFNEEYISNGYYYTYDDTWSVPGETTTLDGAGYYPQATINFLLGAEFRF